MPIANISIHPRVWLGGEKSNTMRTKHATTLQRAIDGTQRHLSTHPRDSMAARRIETFTTRLTKVS